MLFYLLSNCVCWFVIYYLVFVYLVFAFLALLFWFALVVVLICLLILVFRLLGRFVNLLYIVIIVL